MKKVFAFLMFVGVIALAACSTTTGSDGDGDGGECSGGCSGSSKMDNSQSTIDMYANGTMKASYWVQLHADPAAGQYWETSSEMSGMVMTSRWQIAKVDGDMAIVEQQSKMDSEYMVSDYVLAFQVDLTVTEPGAVNVTKAWVGKPGEKGAEIEIMEKPEATCGGCAPEVDSVTEDFSDLELAGGKWSGKVTTTTVSGTESKVWMADEGWFGGMIKMQSGDYVNELTAFGTDAEALLAWE